MEMYSLVCMEINKQTKQYYPGCIEKTDKWSCVFLWWNRK
jgi:hypothetical protein